MDQFATTISMKKPLPRDYQKMLFPYAYNIVGSVEDAQDIVQEAIIKYMESGHEDLEYPKSYLIKIVVNQAINHKRLIRHQREFYPGTWLPEPLAIERKGLDNYDKEKILTYSLMVMLEKLSGKERAVYILKEVFSYSHGDICKLLDMTIENSRQLLKRGRQKMDKRKPMEPMTLEENDYINSFLKAFNESDFDSLEKLLVDDITMSSDSGGKVQAARKVIYGKTNVMKMIRGLISKFYHQAELELSTMNHRPAFVVRINGIPQTVILFDNKDKMIRNIYVMRNPEKMSSL